MLRTKNISFFGQINDILQLLLYFYYFRIKYEIISVHKLIRFFFSLYYLFTFVLYLTVYIIKMSFNSFRRNRYYTWNFPLRNKVLCQEIIKLCKVDWSLGTKYWKKWSKDLSFEGIFNASCNFCFILKYYKLNSDRVYMS